MPISSSFYDVLTRAINDVAEHGYDAAQRIESWMDQLRRAAEASMKGPAQMEQMLRDALNAIYTKLVEKGGALSTHPGMPRFTLERIKPQLRLDLDRRIFASAALIKANREEAIGKTLQRFQAWATSIPIGGSADPEKQKTKAEVRKSIAGLPFAERRVLIDQGHKLGASINATVSVGAGAIGGIWHSNYRQPGYDYRPDHKERDGKFYLLRDSWAKADGYVKVGPAGYTDDVTQPCEEPFCRCRWQFVFNLRQLPDDMLTAKGREKLEAVRVA